MRGVAITLAGFAIITLLLAWGRWLSRHRLASLGHVALATVAAALATVVWTAADSLAGFEPRRTPDVAEIHFERTGPGRYRATLLRLPTGRVQVFEMPGERWRIAARTLDWLGPAAALGLKPAFQLDWLQSAEPSGASQDAIRRTYALAEPVGFDVWSKARHDRFWSRYAVGGEAAGPWLPMSRGARYAVRIAGAKLVVEPSDDGAPPLTPGKP